jgi:hypothetical protein
VIPTAAIHVPGAYIRRMWSLRPLRSETMNEEGCREKKLIRESTKLTSAVHRTIGEDREEGEEKDEHALFILQTMVSHEIDHRSGCDQRRCRASRNHAEVLK